MNLINIQGVPTQPILPQHVDISFTEYTMFGTILIGAALIIGYFLKAAFNQLTQSNKDLKDSIEKLADIANNIHTDLLTFKTEVAEKYVTKIKHKEDIEELKEGLEKICNYRHSEKKELN